MNTAETRNTGPKLNVHDTEEFSADEREEFVSHLFETVREPLVALNADLRVKFANKNFYRAFQVTSEQTLGKLIYDLGNGQWNIPKLKMLLEEIIPQDETFNDFEVEHKFEHIGLKNMLLNARRVNGGRLILLAIEDVTERRRMENELSTFAHLASHDLKEPLRTIMSYLALLERQSNRHDKQSEKYIGFALDGARRMSALINNLLVHSSVGRQAKVGPVNFNVAYENVIGDLKLSLSEAGAKITKGTLPTILGDSSEYEQLLQNLISNAIKYRGKGSPEVHISAERRDNKWLFKVADNGMGIAKENQKRIFDAFLRLHSRSEHPGTGLGLSTCQKIVESHGGTIWVESSPGHGSNFFFTLPPL